jgi:hypothetical protein
MSGLVALLAIAILYRKRNASGASAALPGMPGSLRRALLVLIVVGLVLIATMPEAFFVLPAFDAVGLDVATILIALELQGYLQGVFRLVASPAIRLLWRRTRYLCLNLAGRVPADIRPTAYRLQCVRPY